MANFAGMLLLPCRSPIYDSISKEGYLQHAAFSDRGTLADGISASRHPVLALGGVTPDKFSELAEWGFSGAALLGAVWQADDPVAAFQAAQEKAERVA